MTTLKLVDLGGAYLARGSPASLVVVEGETAYVVDPGYPPKRGRLLRKAINKLGVRRVTVVLTHSHGDHVAATPSLSPDEVYAPLPEIAAAELPELREAVALGYPFHSKTGIMLFEPIGVNNVKPLQDGIGPLRVLPLPGHTFGHVGLLAGDVVYAGDSVFGDRLLERVGVPFYMDHRLAFKSMEKLAQVSSKSRMVVLSHGPLVSGEEALRLIEANRRRLEEISRLVREALKDRPMSSSEVAATILSRLGAEISPLSLVLASTTVRSFVAELYEKGELEPAVKDGRLVWMTKP